MPRNAAAYDEDFVEWTVEQTRLLRTGALSEIDIENLAEEIESMGRSTRRELRSRLAGLLTHLLKWQYQPGFRSRSWAGTIRKAADETGFSETSFPAECPFTPEQILAEDFLPAD
ncbi:MAG TPA: DUF29 domain-containing protein [Stellaceae bacterium]|jgi:hypothetical protein|nr:DUF29 domain-containing protein [Stellaceae bacterium]